MAPSAADNRHPTKNFMTILLCRSGCKPDICCFSPRLKRSENMRRIGILTAGGDTPALNATIHGAVVRANQLKIEVFGIIKGFSGMLNPRVPHVHLNPLFSTIPELNPCLGGTLL